MEPMLVKYIMQITKYCLFLLIGVLFFSCGKYDVQFPVGTDLIKSDMNISITDTLSVQLSTSMIDSLETSGADTLLVGHYTDDRLGPVQTTSFFRFLIPTATVNNTQIFDSLILVMSQNGYYYGDTNVMQHITIHQLGSNLTLGTGVYYYNISSAAYDDESTLGEIYFKPTPKTRTQLSIKIDSLFGQKLFNLMVAKDQIILDDADFHNYFQGVAAVPDANDQSIVGFTQRDTMLYMRMYLHANNEYVNYYNFTFKVETGINHFSQISEDRSATPLKNLVNQETDIPSTSTNNEVYLQGGTGLTPIVRIPYLGKLLELQNTVILKAELILSPVDHTYDYNQIPTTISYYGTNTDNQVIGSYFDPSSGRTLYGSLNLVDPLYNENTYYVFDITPYIKQQLASKYFTPSKAGLLLAYNKPSFNVTVNRLVLGGENHPTKKAIIKLYTMHYE